MHENARIPGATTRSLAERLDEPGYRTAAFVSSLPAVAAVWPGARLRALRRRAAGAEDERVAARRPTRARLPRRRQPTSPSSGSTTSIRTRPTRRRSRSGRGFAADPYLGRGGRRWIEQARAPDRRPSSAAPGGGARLLIVGDHGEGLGDHGELQHGHLLYQSTMHVPLVLAGAGSRRRWTTRRSARGGSSTPCSHWAGSTAPAACGRRERGRARRGDEAVSRYGWQPQTMAVDGRQKPIRGHPRGLRPRRRSGARRRISAPRAPPRALAKALAEAIRCRRRAPRAAPMGDEERRSLASLGYIASEGAPVAVPENAPRAAEMTRLFEALDARIARLRERRLCRRGAASPTDHPRRPRRPSSTVRLAVAQSFLRTRRGGRGELRRRAADRSRFDRSRPLPRDASAEGRPWRRGGAPFRVGASSQPERSPHSKGSPASAASRGGSRRRPRFRSRCAVAGVPAPLLAELGQVRMAMADTPGRDRRLRKARMPTVRASRTISSSASSFSRNAHAVTDVATDFGSDRRTPVPALRAVALAAEADHQRLPCPGGPADVPARRGRFPGEAVAGQRWAHHVKGVLGAPAVCGRSVSGPMTLPNSMIDPGQPCVMTSGKASGCGER